MVIVLCSPPNSQRFERRAESLGIRYLASAAQDFDIRLIDAHCWGWDIEKTIAAIIAARPTLVGLQLIFHQQVPAAAQIIEAVRTTCPSTIWIAGGHVPTFSPSEVLNRIPALSGVITGEAERSFIHFLTALRSGASPIEALRVTPGATFLKEGEPHRIPQAPLLADLDSLKYPLRHPNDFLQPRAISMIGSRGCYARCDFCSVPQFFMDAPGPLWRLRSVGNIIGEIEHLIRDFGVTHISFLDDIFLAKTKKTQSRASDFADGLMSRKIDVKYSIECRTDAVSEPLFAKLKSSGLARVFIGLEAGDDQTLERYEKWTTEEDNVRALNILRSLEIETGIGFILFHPDITLTELWNNIEFLHRHNILTHRALVSRVSAYPGTPVWQRLKAQGRLNGDPLSPSYRFSIAGMEELANTLKQVLSPLSQTDLLFHRAEFRISKPPLEASVSIRRHLSDLRKSYSDDLYELALQILPTKMHTDSVLQPTDDKMVDQWLDQAQKVCSYYNRSLLELISNTETSHDHAGSH